MKKAFTLVELLVVIGIIGILAGVLMGTFSGSTESARNARCLSNLKNLASACQNYAVSSGCYPCAGSCEKVTISSSRSNGRRVVKETYHEVKSWVSWNSQGAYQSAPSQSVAGGSWNTSTYESDEQVRLYCLTNGALWKCVGGNREVYRCPSHVRAKKALNPNWSYVMNAYFYWTTSPGKDIKPSDFGGVWYGSLDRADRRLLFAEIPFANIGVQSKENTAAGEDCDCILQYKGCEGSSANETIGFNHRMGKLYCAHVAFADGHVEKLTYPKAGLSESELQELTKWLCTGKDISFDGKKYDTMTE